MISRIHWQSPQIFWITAIVLAATLAGLIWLYRPQLRSTPRVWSWMLLSLRSIAITALAVSLLRPSLLVPAASADRDIIAVLVDRSRSMSVVDQDYSSADLVRLAAALNLLPQDIRATNLAVLQQKVNELSTMATEVALAKSELDYARLAGRGIEPAEAHQRDVQRALIAAVRTTADAAPSDLNDRIGHLTPDNATDEIPGILAQIDAAQYRTDQSLYEQNVPVREIADELALTSREGIVQHAVLSQGGPLSAVAQERMVRYFSFSSALLPLSQDTAELTADANRTDLAGSLRQLRQALSGQRVGAVVVFSDGRQSAGEPASNAPLNDIPLIMVPTGNSVSRDLVISRVAIPTSAQVGESVMVRVDVSAIGFNGKYAEVVVASGAQRTATSVPVLSDAAHADLPLVVTHPGAQEVLISVTSQPGEVTSENNTVKRFVKGLSERLKVALIAGTASRDIQQLQHALRRSGSSVIADVLADGARNCALSAEKIASQDVVVLYDVPVTALSSAQWEAVNDVAKVQDGGVLLVCSDPALISSYSSRAVAEALLPWEPGEIQPAWRVWPGEDPRLRIIPAQADVPELMPLASDPDISRLRWAQLPPVFGFIALPPLRAGARALLNERDSGLPVLSEVRLTSGRSLFLGLNELWRWRSSSEEDQDRIWMQILRYAAPQPYAIGDGTIFLDADQIQTDQGGRIRLRARMRETELAGVSLSLEVRRDSERFQEIALQPVAGSTNRYEATIDDLAVGSYEIRLSAGQHSVILPLHVAESSEAEMKNVAVDISSLQRLAGARGQILPLDQLQSLPQRIAKLQRNEPELVEKNLWDSKYLFLFVLGCLGLEWAIRKRLGLA